MELSNKERYRAALRCMKDFFKNKKTRLGKELSKSKLFTPQNLKIVATLDIISACDIAYSSMARYRKPRDIEINTPTVDWEIELVLRLLGEMKSLSIPKDFQGGLIVLYLKFCRGYLLAKPNA